MNIEIIKLDFERNSKGHILFNQDNMKKLNTYVIPIIKNNEGWGTGELTPQTFQENPERWREDINSTVTPSQDGEVHIYLQNNRPIGLLEYIKRSFDNVNLDFSNALKEMLKDKGSRHWKKLREYVEIDPSIFNKYFNELEDFVRSRQFYRFIGVALIPELQGKKSGISDILYKKMDNGFIFGRTSTPLVVTKRRKLFKETILFPVRSNEINSLETLSCLTVASARLLSTNPEDLSKYDFGISSHAGFVQRDKDEYMELNKSFLEKGKITETDYEKLNSILKVKKGAGVVISVS